MKRVDVQWRMSIPELLSLADAGLDDADADGSGNVYVTDCVNGRIYKFAPTGILGDVFDVALRCADGANSLNIGVSDDSLFYLCDTRLARVLRYDETGQYLGEFPVPGVLSLCSGPDGVVYALTDVDGQQHVVTFDQMGNPISEMPGPARANAILDPTIVNLDSDADGNVYVTYGVPPYQVWRLSADGSGIDTMGRDLDQPADTILVSDIACDRKSGILWVLLGIREQGLQTIDAFSPDGRLLGSFGIPLSESILNVACACDSGLYLVNTGGTGPSSGDLLRISALLV